MIGREYEPRDVKPILVMGEYFDMERLINEAYSIGAKIFRTKLVSRPMKKRVFPTIVLLLLLASVLSFSPKNAGATIPVDELITRDKPIVQEQDQWRVSWYLLQEMPYVFNISVTNLKGEVRKIELETIFSDLDLDKLSVNGFFEWKNITHTVEVADYEIFYNETSEQNETMVIGSHHEEKYWFDWNPCKYQYFTKTAQEYRENMGEITIGKYEKKQFQLRFSPPMGYSVKGRIALQLGETLFDPWYDLDWGYRKNHTINSATGAGTNYQMNITVHYGSGTDSEWNVYLNSKCQTDFDDIRFTDDDGETLLDYWIEEIHTGDNCTVWVEVADDLGSNQVIWLYYGNDAASTASDGSETFLVWHDFEVGIAGWTSVGGAISQSGDTAKHGSYSMKINDDSGVNPEGGYTTFSGMTTYRMKFWYNVSQTDKNMNWYIMDVGDNEGPTFRFATDASIEYYPGDWTDFVDPYIADTWYEFEVLGNVSVDEMDVYVDDVLEIDDGDFWKDTGDTTKFSILGGASDLLTAYIDTLFLSKYVSTEPSHGVWGEQESNDPSNDAASILNMDDSDNVYSQLRAYNFIFNVSDADGVTELDTILYSMSPDDSNYINGTINCQTNAHSFTAGSDNVIAGSVTNVTAGTTANYTLPLTTQWDIPELSNWDIWLWVNDTKGGNSSWGRMQNDYFDTVNSVVTINLAASDTRVNIGGTSIVSGDARYANDPSSNTSTTFYPPDAEFTAIHIHNPDHESGGNDTTVVNGAFSVTVTLPETVGNLTHHPYIDFADADGVDGDPQDFDEVWIIADRQQVQTLWANNTTPNRDEPVEIYAIVQSEHDAHVLGAGDSLVLKDADANTYTFTYNGSHWVNVTSWASDRIVFIGTYDSVNEATYGITILDMNSPTLIITVGTPNERFSIFLSSLYNEVEEGFYNLLIATAIDSDGDTHADNVTFTVDGASFEWNDYTDQYEARVKESTPQTVTYDTLDSFTDADDPTSTGYINQTATATWTTSVLDTMKTFMQTGDWMGTVITINTELLGALFLYTFIMVALSAAIYNYTGAEATLLAWILGWGMWSTVVHGTAVTIGLIFLSLGGGLLIVKMFLDSRRTQ